MIVRYEYKSFHPSTRILFDKANHIINDYKELGIKLTLLQLYYILVSRGDIENTEKSYKNFTKNINNGKMAGKIAWDSLIIDDPSKTRIPEVNIWHQQKFHVELIVEKKQFVDLSRLAIPCTIINGYPSSTGIWNIAQRLRDRAGVEEPFDVSHDITKKRAWELSKLIKENFEKFGEKYFLWTPYEHGRIPVILYLGDLKPGWDTVFDDIEYRLGVFRAPCLMKRIGVNKSHAVQAAAPHSPSQSKKNLTLEPDEPELSWDIESIEPKKLQEIVDNAVMSFFDPDARRKTSEQGE